MRLFCRTTFNLESSVVSKPNPNNDGTKQLRNPLLLGAATVRWKPSQCAVLLLPRCCPQGVEGCWVLLVHARKSLGDQTASKLSAHSRSTFIPVAWLGVLLLGFCFVGRKRTAHGCSSVWLQSKSVVSGVYLHVQILNFRHLHCAECFCIANGMCRATWCGVGRAKREQPTRTCKQGFLAGSAFTCEGCARHHHQYKRVIRNSCVSPLRNFTSCLSSN